MRTPPEMSGTAPAAQGAPRPDARLSFVRHGTPDGRGRAAACVRFLPVDALSGACPRRAAA